MKLYEIENEYIKAKVCDYGATLQSLYIKSFKTDVVLGFNQLSKYKDEGKYFGQTIGRISNRIQGGKFTFNNIDYQLELNDNNINNLHSGDSGLHTKYFKVIQEETKISCYYTLQDKEEGLPGILDIIVIYELIDNRLKITMKGIAQTNTLCSLTNHSYFNLKGTNTIEDHNLWIDANSFGELDNTGVTLDNQIDVTNTPFDFREPKLIKPSLDSDHPQILSAKGLDHNYCLNNNGYNCKAILTYLNREMKVYTNMNNMHVYSGNYFENQIGKQEEIYKPRAAIAFETQEYPNAINYNKDKKPLLNKGEVYINIVTLEFNNL